MQRRLVGTLKPPEMRPGPDLDAEVVRKLWRYLVVLEPETGKHLMVSAFGREAIPPYSTSQDAVAQVIEFFEEQGWKLRSRRDGTNYAAAFIKKDAAQYRYFCAETLPEAICNAALAIANGTNIQSR